MLWVLGTESTPRKSVDLGHMILQSVIQVSNTMWTNRVRFKINILDDIFNMQALLDDWSKNGLKRSD